MGWFGKKLVLDDWEIKDEDFLTDSLDDYDEPHLKAILLEARGVIPEKYYDQVFIGGGFASHLAGITTEHSDVDIFCLTENAFDEISNLIKGEKNPERFQAPTLPGISRPIEVESRAYGKVLKFVCNGIQYDLVDSALRIDVEPDKTPGILNLLKIFDINWCMVAIDLAANTITCHKDALLCNPKMNVGAFGRGFDGAIRRMHIYAKRLRKAYDEKEVQATAVILNHMLKEGSEKEARTRNGFSY